ncbi:MAG: DUF4339 domain-containing protein, partial [Bdellovibrionota bacterium]
MSSYTPDTEAQPTKRTLWYLFIDNAHQGPYTTEDIFLRLQQGEIGYEDYIWKEEMDSWVQIADLPAPLGKSTVRQSLKTPGATLQPEQRLRTLLREQTSDWTSKRPEVNFRKYRPLWKTRRFAAAVAIVVIGGATLAGLPTLQRMMRAD